MGSSALDRVLRERMRVSGAVTLEEYAVLLESSAQEQRGLLEAVVVPETWFFRDAALFESLKDIVRVLRSGPRSSEVLRWLSIPCSTGEEPYSVAMALIDSLQPAGSCEVTGVDLSSRSIEFAQRGIYGRNSFRGEDTSYRERFFDSDAGQSRLQNRVRDWVRFRQGNILGDGFAAELGLFDVVFCRNMLIYFDEPSRLRAMAVLTLLTRPGGFLCLTPAEAPVTSGTGFARIPGFPLSVFRRVEAGWAPSFAAPKPAYHPLPGPSVAAAPLRTQPVAITPQKPAFGSASANLSRASQPPPLIAKPETPSVVPKDWLAEAGVAADRGELDLALSLCLQSIKSQGASAQAYCLLGLVQDSRGQAAEAVASYRKALYLEPAHPEALLHLSALLEAQGDKVESARLRQRATRARGNSL